MIVWLLDLQLHVQSVSITTNVGEEYSIQHYEIKFVSDLRQVGGFPRVLRFSPPIYFDRHDITEILLKVMLNTKAKNQLQIVVFLLLYFVSEEKSSIGKRGTY